MLRYVGDTRQRYAVVQMLASTQQGEFDDMPVSMVGGGANGDDKGATGWSDQWKLLVYDRSCRDVISPLMSVSSFFLHCIDLLPQTKCHFHDFAFQENLLTLNLICISMCISTITIVIFVLVANVVVIFIFVGIAIAIRHSRWRWYLLLLLFRFFNVGSNSLSNCQVSALRKQGVTLHMLLDHQPKREQIHDVPALYFVTPTEENVDRICTDIEAKLYDSFHIHFVTPVPRPLLETMAKRTLQANAVDFVEKIYDQYLSFVSLESNLFTLNHKNSFVQVSHTPWPVLLRFQRARALVRID